MNSSGFDPYVQNVTLLDAAGQPVYIPVPAINHFNDETVGLCISYGCQLGACIATLAISLLLTPTKKLARPSTLLQLFCLLVCVVRTVLLCIYYLAPFNHFYEFWGNDFSAVNPSWFQMSIASTVVNALLALSIELALMHQAWTMVSLWSLPIKLTICTVSALVTVNTVAWRIAYAVFQVKATTSADAMGNMVWVSKAALITNCLSIAWFCAIFNTKLVMHLISNRGILPSHRAMTPMEILVATNGILMVLPLIFAGLEFGQFQNFEAASWSFTTVALVLPMGSLTAQRAAQRPTQASHASSANTYSSYGTYKPSRGKHNAAEMPSCYRAAFKRSPGYPNSINTNLTTSTFGSSGSGSGVSQIQHGGRRYKAVATTRTNGTNPSHAREDGTQSSPSSSSSSAAAAIRKTSFDPVSLELRNLDGFHIYSDVLHAGRRSSSQTPEDGSYEYLRR